MISSSVPVTDSQCVLVVQAFKREAKRQLLQGLFLIVCMLVTLYFMKQKQGEEAIKAPVEDIYEKPYQEEL